MNALTRWTEHPTFPGPYALTLRLPDGTTAHPIIYTTGVTIRIAQLGNGYVDMELGSVKALRNWLAAILEEQP